MVRKQKRFSVSLDEETYEWLRLVSFEQRIPMTTIINRALKEFKDKTEEERREEKE